MCMCVFVCAHPHVCTCVFCVFPRVFICTCACMHTAPGMCTYARACMCPRVCMCPCARVRMCTCSCACACMPTCIARVCMCVCMCAHVHVHVGACVCAYLCMWTHASVYEHVCACVYVPTCAFPLVCMCVHSVCMCVRASVPVCTFVCVRDVKLGHNLKSILSSAELWVSMCHHSEAWISHLLNEINGDYFEGFFWGSMAVIHARYLASHLIYMLDMQKMLPFTKTNPFKI